MSTTTPIPECPIPECLACGACCFQRPGTILVTATDVEYWHQIGRPDMVRGLVEGHFGQMAFAMNLSGACVHLGMPNEPYACSQYAVRASVCRDFQRGSPQCQEFIRDKIRRESKDSG